MGEEKTAKSLENRRQVACGKVGSGTLSNRHSCKQQVGEKKNDDEFSTDRKCLIYDKECPRSTCNITDNEPPWPPDVHAPNKKAARNAPQKMGQQHTTRARAHRAQCREAHLLSTMACKIKE